jgi:hypothetical protein
VVGGAPWQAAASSNSPQADLIDKAKGRSMAESSTLKVDWIPLVRRQQIASALELASTDPAGSSIPPPLRLNLNAIADDNR